MTRRGRLSQVIAIGALAALELGGCASTPVSEAPGMSGWESQRRIVIDRILGSTVQIVLEREGKRVRSGSGVVVAGRPSATGAGCFVLTSGHTLDMTAADSTVHVLLKRHRGSGTKVPATVLAYHDADDVDVGLLSIDIEDCPGVTIGRSPDIGDEVWVVAFPWGGNMNLVGGVISQVGLEGASTPEGAPQLMVDASVSYGASGGGVYSARTGNLVGLIESYRTARVSFQVDRHTGQIDVPVPGETYVVSLAQIRRFLAATGHAGLLGTTRSSAGAHQ